MDNQKYWEDRAAWNMYHYMDEAEKTADIIAEIYRKASMWLSYEAAEVFERYMTKHKLSEKEARELLNTLRDKTDIQELLQKLANGDSDISKRELLSQLEAPAYQARLERLRQLQNQIDLVMQNIYQQEKTFSTKFYVDLANEAYYRSIFEIQKHTGLAFSFSHIDNEQIDHVLAMNWSGEHYSKRIWKNTQALAQDLKEELLINLITGRTERETADIIANRFAVGTSKARRLVRTESCFISGELDAKAYEECEVEWYIFIATLDLRTSKICRSLDGKRFKVSERKAGVNYRPMHPWCRSTSIGDITKEALNQLKRRAFNPATRQTEMVPASMTYAEWYKKYVEGKPEAEAQEKAIRYHAADKKQYKAYKEVLENNVPDSFVKFQRMKYNEPERWNELKEAYRDVNWQRKALENHTSGTMHSPPCENQANSVFDNYKNGQLLQRRYYGKTGKPRLDIDMTNHGNPKQHSVVPHYHNWNEIEDGKFRRDAEHDNELRLGHRIANKDIL